jgi:hypothetical protein
VNFSKIRIPLLLVSITILTYACKKKPEGGCTDYYADNFSETAIEDDGSCEYSSTLELYAFGNGSLANTIVELYSYIDGEVHFLEEKATGEDGYVNFNFEKEGDYIFFAYYKANGGVYYWVSGSLAALTGDKFSANLDMFGTNVCQQIRVSVEKSGVTNFYGYKLALFQGVPSDYNFTSHAETVANSFMGKDLYYKGSCFFTQVPVNFDGSDKNYCAYVYSDSTDGIWSRESDEITSKLDGYSWDGVWLYN